MKLRTLGGYIHPRWRDPETCESCGEAFICGARLTGCWCTGVKLSETVRAGLRTRFTRCLCRKCLEKFAADGGREAPEEP
jgi:hypothetical protein